MPLYASCLLPYASLSEPLAPKSYSLILFSTFTPVLENIPLTFKLLLSLSLSLSLSTREVLFLLTMPPTSPQSSPPWVPRRPRRRRRQPSSRLSTPSPPPPRTPPPPTYAEAMRDFRPPQPSSPPLSSSTRRSLQRQVLQLQEDLMEREMELAKVRSIMDQLREESGSLREVLLVHLGREAPRSRSLPPSPSRMVSPAPSPPTSWRTPPPPPSMTLKTEKVSHMSC